MKINIKRHLLPSARRVLRRFSLVAGLSAGLAFPGCINSNSECIEDQPGYEEGNDVWLTFDIHNIDDSQGRSRAVTDPSHPDEAASAAENFINCEDYDLTVMYLNNNGRVMKVFNRDEFVIVPVNSADNLNREYELKLHINQDYFPLSEGNVEFSLLVVANLNGTNDGGSFGLNWMASVADLSALKTSFGYTGLNGSEAWTPDIAAKRLIPMAGIRRFSVPRLAIMAATDADNPFDLSDGGNTIDMQRAMAKIRVLDGLVANGDTDNEIVAVTLTGMNTRGAYIPQVTAIANNSWATNTDVCHIAQAHTSWYASASALPSYNLTHNGNGGWGFYIPEFSTTLGPVDADPTLNITVRSSSTGEERTYNYPVSRSLGGSDMTRNHIYEFIVTEVAGTDAELTLNVRDWDEQETIWDYTDNPGLAEGKAIKFDETTCGVSYPEAEVVFRNDRHDIEAQFTLAQPVNATWHAVFIHEKGTQGAFKFVDASGKEVESVSGNIDGVTPANLTIRTKDIPVDENNEKRLQIIVTMADGRSVTADVLKGGGYGANKTYIKIIQNKQIQ